MKVCHSVERAAARLLAGTQWRYSLATDVCGHLVEALSGQLLDEHEHILSLGGDRHRFSVLPDKADRFAPTTSAKRISRWGRSMTQSAAALEASHVLLAVVQLVRL